MVVKDKIGEVVFDLYMSGENTDEILKNLIVSYVNLVKIDYDNNSNYDIKDKAVDLAYTAIDLINQ